MTPQADVFSIGVAVLVSVSVACQPRQQPPASLSVEQSAAARTALVAWFECEECTDGELDAVVKYGDAIVPSLAATLEGGLSPSKREEVRQHLQETYRAMVEYAKQGKRDLPQLSEQQYSDTYLGNTDSLYRIRAATALGRIGTPASRAALDSALKLKNLRPDVRRRVESALKSQ
jgi:hypothetical protein